MSKIRATITGIELKSLVNIFSERINVCCNHLGATTKKQKDTKQKEIETTVKAGNPLLKRKA
jgi:hypothetical protein